jgi:apolipoprotein N-acyltransferase
VRSAADGADPLLPGAAASVATGLVLGVAFPALDWGPLALVALIPLLWAWDRSGPGRAALYGFLSGVAFFGVLVWWSVYFGAIAIVPFVALLAAYWAGAGAIVGALGRRGVRSPWLTAAIWVVFEALRSRWPLGGFSWGQVGVALHDFPVARHLASLGGVPLVSFVVVLINGLLLAMIVAWSTRGASRRRSFLVPAVTLAAVVALVAVAGVVHYEPRRTGSLRFALLQGNDQDRRLTGAEIDSGYLTRKHLALAAKLKGDFDLIVFPESSVETDPEADFALKDQIVALAQKHHSSVMVNVIDEQTPGKNFNANRLYDPDGTLQGTYAKQHLVPFGEYVPFRDALSFISALQQIPTDFDPGHETKVFNVAGKPIGTVICFESAFAPLMRDSVDKGAGAIVVTTNNRSYRTSPNSAQHLALSQMSAAAVGRPVLHASISGITGVIDAEGGVHQTTELFHNAVVTGRVTTVTGDTPYVRFGDWVEWLCLLGLLGAVVVAVMRRRLAPPHSEPSGATSE